MKQRTTLISSLILLSAFAVDRACAQNLVKNPGFEEVTTPVLTWDQLDHAAGWTNANAGSCDLFQKDCDDQSVAIPDNELGSAAPHDGERYAGFVAYKDEQKHNWKRTFFGTQNHERWIPAYQDYSEYMQIELSGPLEAGKEYDISIRVSLGEHSDRAVSAVGAYASPVLLENNHRHFLTVKPQVWSKEVVKDKQNWTEIKGTFKADGGERFIVIGAFPAAGMDKVSVIEGGDSQRAYYFVDGVSLVLHPEPDTDGDGVIDKLDKCMNVPGLATLQGCPDKDGDGVSDAMDACPDKAGPADKQGCPDTDGDGITDNVDQCPNEKGVASMKGCPEITEATKKLFAKALTGVKFDTGKSTIKPVSFGILDDVVKVMQNNPTYDLEIHGHTDDQGDDAKNLKLSDDRAAAVRAYLTSKGVDAGRLRSEGHGETVPVADNKTAAGRATNRRVEFKVNFWE